MNRTLTVVLGTLFLCASFSAVQAQTEKSPIKPLKNPKPVPSTLPTKRASLQITQGTTKAILLPASAAKDIKSFTVLRAGRATKGVTAKFGKASSRGVQILIIATSDAEASTGYQLLGIRSDKRAVRVPVDITVTRSRTKTPPKQPGKAVKQLELAERLQNTLPPQLDAVGKLPPIEKPKYRTKVPDIAQEETPAYPKHWEYGFLSIRRKIAHRVPGTDHQTPHPKYRYSFNSSAKSFTTTDSVAFLNDMGLTANATTVDLLNRLGVEGWEMVNIHAEVQNSSYRKNQTPDKEPYPMYKTYSYTFKRPIEIKVVEPMLYLELIQVEK